MDVGVIITPSFDILTSIALGLLNAENKISEATVVTYDIIQIENLSSLTAEYIQ
jgi:hypothetical protein